MVVLCGFFLLLLLLKIHSFYRLPPLIAVFPTARSRMADMAIINRIFFCALVL